MMALRPGACFDARQLGTGSIGHDMIDFDVIVAADQRGGIGSDGRLPWQLRGDWAHFRALTGADRSAKPPECAARNAVVMGRKTWESLPERQRPLPDRLNVVATRNHLLALPDGVLRVGSLREGLDRLSALRASGAVAQVFVIGGGEIYTQALVMPQCRRVHLTCVQDRFDCDTFLLPLGERFALTSVSEPQREGALQYRYEIYERVAKPTPTG